MARLTYAARGFTLTELLITLALVGMLAMIGAQAMGNLLAHIQNANIEASIAAGLRHARTAAVMHDARVLVCPSPDGRHCHAGDDWQHGWIIAQDVDYDGQPDAGKQIMAVQTSMPAGTRVITSVGRGYIVFHPNGSAAGSNAWFTICAAREREGESVIVANSGRVRLAKPDPKQLRACLAGIQG